MQPEENSGQRVELNAAVRSAKSAPTPSSPAAQDLGFGNALQSEKWPKDSAAEPGEAKLENEQDAFEAENQPEMSRVLSAASAASVSRSNSVTSANALHSFCMEALASPNFDLQEFLAAARNRAPLVAVRDALQRTLAELNEELVARIQRDFNAFVALGSSLNEADNLSSGCIAPLTEFKSFLLDVQHEVTCDIARLEHSLEQRRELASRRRQLELLLRIFELVGKCERLLRELHAQYIRVSDAADHRTDERSSKMTTLSHEELWRMTERIANDFSQLSSAVARVEVNSAFLTNLQPRIDSIQKDVTRRLRTLFHAALSEYQKQWDIADSSVSQRNVNDVISRTNDEPNASQNELYRVLTAYGAAGLVGEAEHEFRATVVAPFARENLRMVSALARAEMKKGTQLAMSPNREAKSTQGMEDGRPKAAYSQFSSLSVGVATAGEAMEAAEELIRLFVKQKCEAIIKICVPQGGDASNSMSVVLRKAHAEHSALRQFDFGSRSVWPELVACMMEQMSPVFSPGIPDVFHRSFLSMMRVYDCVKSTLCLTELQRQNISSCDSTLTLWKRWNLPVYFQLRFQQIAIPFVDDLKALSAQKEARPAASLRAIGSDVGDGRQTTTGDKGADERSLHESTMDTVQEQRAELELAPTTARVYRLLKSDVYHLSATRALIVAIRKCWSDDVFLGPLAHRFLRLSLQLLSRYAAWVRAGVIRADRVDAKISNGIDAKNSNGTSKWASSLDPQEFLKVVTHAYSDIEQLKARFPAEMASLLRVQVGSVLPSSVLIALDSSFRAGLEAVAETLPALAAAICFRISASCSEALQPLRGILATFRMTNKPPPTQHSRFVPNVLKPLHAFLHGFGSTLSPDAKLSLTVEVVQVVSQKYLDMASELLESVKKAEDVLKRLSLGSKNLADSGSFGDRPRAARSVLSNAGAGQAASSGKASAVSPSSDSDKISLQLFLDVRKFGAEIELLGVSLEKVDAYQRLWAFIHSECGALLDQKS